MHFINFKETPDDVRISGSDKYGLFTMFGTFKDGKVSLVKEYANDGRKIYYEGKFENKDDIVGHWGLKKG